MTVNDIPIILLCTIWNNSWNIFIWMKEIAFYSQIENNLTLVLQMRSSISDEAERFMACEDSAES